MIPDPTEQIKEIRRNLASQFDNDVTCIGADIRRKQCESGRIYIMLPKRAPMIARALDMTPVNSKQPFAGFGTSYSKPIKRIINRRLLAY
jgi:hypothetical protein